MHLLALRCVIVVTGLLYCNDGSIMEDGARANQACDQ